MWELHLLGDGMTKIKSPTDLLIKENALKLLWEIHRLSITEELSSNYKISKNTGLKTNTVSNYLKTWSKYGLIMMAKDEQNTVLGFDPRVIEFDDHSVYFKVNGLKIQISPE